MCKRDVSTDFPVVGIGASAGGLDPLKSFLGEISHPEDIEIAYVVIQHLDPDHESILDSILQQVTDLEVREIEDGIEIKPGFVYINPPQKKIRIDGHRFQTSGFDPQEVPKLPIDYFFRSLAGELEKKGICIVLSGTGADGSTGLEAVKGAGGMTIAQEESQAEYRGMPHSAIETGLVDYVLPVEEMPAKVLNYARHPYAASPEKTEIKKKQFRDTVPKIFSLIRKRTGHDFSNYKSSTIRRRLGRRMAVHHIESLNEYYKYLQQNGKEVDKLFEDILITVTNFFRESDTFEFLKKEVLTELIEGKSDDSSLRVWVPGSSTGEEAYTIGILLAEIIDERQQHQNVQVFATDLNKRSIDFARKGIFPESIAADLSEKRLNRFFEKEGDGYKIVSRIRKMVIFAEHDLAGDPPLSGMDLVSCRNVLIYMNQKLHEKVIPFFHYALNKDGFLLLGSSESVGGFTDLFDPVDKKKGIYRRKESKEDPRSDNWEFTIAGREDFQADRAIPDKTKTTDLKQLARETILDRYSYPGVLIDEKYGIHYFHGNTEKYLAPPEGRPDMNVLNMARGSLRYKLTTAIQEAVKREEEVVKENVPVAFNGEESQIDLVVKPLEEKEAKRRLLMVVFKELEPPEGAETPEGDAETPTETSVEKANRRVRELEEELKTTKRSLQTTIEEMETSNEELKSRNEELQATNEELRSTNEELKTAREEAQSTNEELSSVNQELEEKIDELSRAKDDMKNLLDNTEIAIVFLDTDFRVRRFTPEATEVFNLIDSDLGRPITDLSRKFPYEDMEEGLDRVLDTLQSTSKEISTGDGDWYDVEIKPYRTTENVVDGLVVTCKDITRIKRKRLKKLRRLVTVIEDSNDAITVLNVEGEVQEWNRGAEEMYGYSEAEAKELNIQDLVPESAREEAEGLIEKARSDQPLESTQTKRLTKDGEVLDVWLTPTKLLDESDDVYGVATTERNIGEFKRMEKSYEERVSELETRLEKAEEGKTQGDETDKGD